MDHIRGGAKDDHAFLELWFTPTGQLKQARTQMKIQGHRTVDTKIVSAGAALFNPGAAAAAEVIVDIFNSLSAAINKMGEHGGRVHFPSIVKHNINAISVCVSGGT